MTLFFDTLESLHRFSLGTDLKRDYLVCKHCDQTRQFVSHGFIYKKASFCKQRIVGKRLLCSSRHRKTGCGRTLSLSLAEKIPYLHYTTTHLFVFLLALLDGTNIQDAYTKATGSCSARHAYRWLNRLYQQLPTYRNRFQRYPAGSPCTHLKHRSHTVQLILTTINRLLSSLGYNACRTYQIKFQSAFF